MFLRRAALAALLVLSAATAFAQDADALARAAHEAYVAKRYGESADHYAAAIAAGIDEPAFYYNAACAAALAGRTEAAFALLRQATAAGYTDVAAIRKDTDLAALHADPRFEALLVDTSRAVERNARFWKSPAFSTPYQPVLDEDQRVAGLSRLWSEAKYNFANFDLVPALDWDALYASTLPRVRAATDTTAYYRELRRFIAQLHDGHSSLVVPAQVSDQLDAQPGLRTRLVEGRVFVHELLDPGLAATGIAPGMEIVTVEGMPVAAWAEANIAPWQPASTPQDRASRTYERALLSGPLDTPARITARGPGGRLRAFVLPRMAAKDFDARYWGGPTFSLRMLPGGIALVRLGHFGDRSAADAFAAHFDQIASARGLVIDVRDNGGGNSSEGYRILAMLSDRPFRTSQWRTRAYLPAYRAWGRPEGTHAGEAGEVQPDGQRHYAGPVVLLTSARTYSAAEDFVVAFDAMRRGRIIGEPTGGSTGQPLVFDLPGGGKGRICTKRDSYPDGREFVGVGVQPQVRVSPRVRDLPAGRDTVLEAALQSM